jgi:flagellar secretion chaperone FliS
MMLPRNASAAYRKNSGQSATPAHLVILLYDQLIQDLMRAITAIEQRDIEARTLELNHALDVLGHLQATLDKEKGGEIAENLGKFYAIVRSNIVTAQIRVSVPILRKQIVSLVELRAAWQEVDRQSSTPPQPGARVAVSANSEEDVTNWRV